MVVLGGFSPVTLFCLDPRFCLLSLHMQPLGPNDMWCWYCHFSQVSLVFSFLLLSCYDSFVCSFDCLPGLVLFALWWFCYHFMVIFVITLWWLRNLFNGIFVIIYLVSSCLCGGDILGHRHIADMAVNIFKLSLIITLHLDLVFLWELSKTLLSLYMDSHLGFLSCSLSWPMSFMFQEFNHMRKTFHLFISSKRVNIF